MPRKHKIGEEINGYRITHVFDSGAMALAYAADAGDGTRTFLKQYKSPSISVPWYRPYIAYQGELNRRISGSRAVDFCVRPLQSFEASSPTSFWVAYEFVEGHDLQGLLDPTTVTGHDHARDTWDNRVVWAKLLMAAVASVHDAGVIHADLKPKNVHLIADPSIRVGYELKLIDMDFSILIDGRVPWIDTMGYVGTNGYRSPEHFIPGLQPEPASDVFTCGLMLYELLGMDGSPYPADDEAQYQKMAVTHAAALPRLRGRLPSPDADSGRVAEIIHRCLSPDAAARPTAEEVKRALNGKFDSVVAPATAAAERPERAEARRATAIPAARGATAGSSSSIRLTDATGRTLTIGVRTDLSKELLRGFGEDARYWHSPQCTIKRDASGAWHVDPNPAAKNDTILNGKAICLLTALMAGDVLAVGNAEKGVVKMPLTVGEA